MNNNGSGEKDRRVDKKPFIQCHPLLSMFFVLVGMLALCVVAALAWYHSDADVDRVRAAAKVAGVELDVGKARGPISSQNILDTLEKLSKLSEQGNLVFEYSDYYETLDGSIEYPNLNGDTSLIRGDPIPQYIHDFYDKHMNKMTHDEIMRCIEQLKGHKIQTDSEWNISTMPSHIIGMQSLYFHLCEWMITLPADQFNKELRSAFMLLESYPDGPLITVLVKNAVAGMLVNTIFHRIQDVSTGIIPHIQTMQKSLQDSLRLSVRIECVYVMNSMSRKNIDIMTSSGFFHKTSEWGQLLTKVQFLYYRERELTAMMQISLAAQSDYTFFCKETRRISKENKDYDYLLLPAHSGAIESIDSVVFQSAVLRAILEKSSLPKDRYGHELKEIHDKQGKLLGYYSIGENGIDDGWRHERDPMAPIWIHGEL